jgi:diaminopimelate decarboxylase
MKRLTTQRRAAFPTPEPAEPPKQLSSLETPVPIVDLDRLAQNLDRMASYCILHGLSLRPHVKTHKSPRIAADQLRLGAIGLTCATPRELEVMGDVSHDLLLAYPLVGATKLARVMYIPHQVKLTVALDSAAALGQLAAAAKVRSARSTCSWRSTSACTVSAFRIQRMPSRSPSRFSSTHRSTTPASRSTPGTCASTKEQDANLERLRGDLGCTSPSWIARACTRAW